MYFAVKCKYSAYFFAGSGKIPLYSRFVLWYDTDKSIVRKGGPAMHPQFAEMTVSWFRRAFVYTGSIGEFRYRFSCDEKERVIHAAAYSDLCYELAQNKRERDFPWDEDGVAQLKDWLQTEYTVYTAQK